MSEYLCFTPDGPGVWVGLRKYFGTTEIIHEHDFFELVLVRAGTGIHLTETGEYQVGPGSVFLVTPGCVHGYRQMSEFEIINILYLPKRLKMELADLAKDAVCQAILGKTADSVLHDGFMLDADHMAIIAYSCGFRESNYFCKLFRRKFFCRRRSIAANSSLCNLLRVGELMKGEKAFLRLVFQAPRMTSCCKPGKLPERFLASPESGIFSVKNS
ncbi:AraC family ligand binding domain-containing protein [Victivallis vadensis]